METRYCAGCPRTFRVMTSSKQMYHNTACEIDNGSSGRSLSWQDRGYGHKIIDGKTVWNKVPEDKLAKKKMLNVEKSMQVTQNLGPAKVRDVKHTEKQTETKKQKDTTLGQLVIARNKTKTKETSTEKTKSENQKKLTTEERKGTQPMASTPQSINTDEGKLQQMNSSEDLKTPIQQSINVLTDTGNIMFNALQQVSKPMVIQASSLADVGKIVELPVDPIAPIDRAKVTAELGKQIISTMRMKLDILKFAKEVIKDK